MTSHDVRTRRFVTQLTGLRIVLTPLVMVLVLYALSTAWGVAGAAALFTVAAVTDVIDGPLARRWRVTGTLGAFLDTTADKLLVSGVLIALVAIDRVSPWIAVIIVGREVAILGLRGWLATTGTVVRPSLWGKMKTNVQFAGVLLAILRPPVVLGPFHLDEWVLGVAALITVLSAVGYLREFAGQVPWGGPSERRPSP